MGKILLVDCEKCTLCGLCVMMCSFKHENEFNPLKARITVSRAIPEGMMVPNVCWQCESPAPCEESCPVEAISRDEETGALVVDHQECTLCETCAEACPYENIRKNSDCEEMIKCDLCGGDPECVKYCAYEALTYVDETNENVEKLKRIKEEIRQLVVG
jgi:carbon-monoxide dehydrogenase iron sulfur subunit